jgi:adenine-specific DNA-methyltransferase
LKAKHYFNGQACIPGQSQHFFHSFKALTASTAIMEKITANHPLSKSADLIKQHVDMLKLLFPTIVKEGKVDFDELKALLGEAVVNNEEYYRFTWAGKSQARQEANKPGTGTLRPAKNESKDWDHTQNIFIEGDNLEVLKLLQKSYAGKIKMIYIDPPYNTGKDFVYRDNYADNLGNYLAITGQTDEEGNRLSTNTESAGRFHSNWLNMMYPRLKLARNLLKDDGVIVISIDDNEIQNLRKLCDEIFGEENMVAQLTLLCNPKGRSQDKYFATNHEYLLIYSLKELPKGAFSIEKDADQVEKEYHEEDDGGKYRLVELKNTHREFGKHSRQNLFYPFYVTADGYVSLENFEGATKVLPVWDDGFEGCWTWDATKAKKDLELLVAVEVKKKLRIYRKSYSNGADKMLKTILLDKEFCTEKGQKELNTLFNTKAKLFQSPKSPFLLYQLQQAILDSNDICLDFFAGSGSTADALMRLNADDGGCRTFICVQLPEKTALKSEAYNAGYKCIADLTKERIRLAGEKLKSKVKNDQSLTPGKTLDTGFRVFKLDTSNLNAWDGSVQNFEQNVYAAAENIKADRSEEDVLYEILLKSGLQLAQSIEEKTIAEKKVFSIGAGALFICLANDLTTAVAEGIGKWKQKLDPATCHVIFKDNGFNDVEKTNSIQLLKRYGINEVNTI